MRHLHPTQALGALRRGVGVEQFLGLTQVDEVAVVRWVVVHPTRDGFEVALHVVEDVGHDEYHDISSFPPLDPEEYTGEGRSLGSAPTAEDAIALAASATGTIADRWVNEGVCQDEYADARTTG